MARKPIFRVFNDCNPGVSLGGGTGNFNLLHMRIKLLSHWHAFLVTVLRILSRTFTRHSCECRTSVVSRTSRKLVAKVFNKFKNFMRIFSPKYIARLSCDGRATIMRVSQTCPCEIFANLQYKIFATLV